jgi:hypothetical protein
MTQTAVAWIIHNIVDDQIGRAKSMTEWLEIFDKAKAMEKEQHSDTWKDGMKSDNGHFGTFEQYYNETYGRTTTASKNDL